MLRDVVRKRMVEAMKNKDKRAKDVYAYLLDEIQKADKNRKTEDDPNPPAFTEAEEVAVAQKVVKAIKSGVDKTMAEAAKNGIKQEDLKAYLEDCEYKIKMYSEFLPEEMSEEKIKAMILETVEGLEAPVNKGMLMKGLMPKVKGKNADGKLVNALVDKYLKGEF